MAIRERKGRASPYQVYWNNPFTGKRESVNFATKEEALKHDSLIKHRLKFERESFRKEDDDNESEEKITLEQAYLLYLREKQFKTADLKRQLSEMRIILKLIGSMELKKIDHGIILKLKDDIVRNSPTTTTAHKRLAVLRAVLNWAAENELCCAVKFPKLPPLIYRNNIPPTGNEILSMLRVAPEHIARVIIIGSQCGLRVGPCEMFQLKWQDIDLNNNILVVHGAKKNLKSLWREIPIRQELAAILRKWHQADMKLSIEHVIHYRCNPVQSIKKAWRNMLAAAGITRNIRPYDLRHAFATELIAAGADIGTVAKLMGHSTPNMVLSHYQYVMDTQKRAAIERLPEIQYVPKFMCPKNEGLQNCLQPLEIVGGPTRI